ncbi:HAD family hydrolase [Actinoalloteichus hymeniacidonis]|uniref:Phosphatase n=1 Tax=Actinoalloteichus hymeniacidonis TaxID=340345 RepID=A0AAC9HUQ5_9PSEU|nr:HAD family hydrolase [Actinoalloteichus hymeniacidonis]AOS66087.1 putative phosphatase [Actinoalloteichus hymeniacidonis]MBB5905809.1 phosphoglycolate phosphatase [Actinoalloteichus hymeniacidonis]
MNHVPVDDTALFRRLFDDADALLLDFDGPVCSVFARYPASGIAAEMNTRIQAAGRALPPEVDATGPHTILRAAVDLSPELGREAEAILRAHEIEAVQSARPTSGISELMASWHATGRPLAIVSNNTGDAIEVYLATGGLGGYVDHVQGRDPHDPNLMKPDPYLLRQAASAIGVDVRRCLLIGDSDADVLAAQAVGCLVIAYATREANRAPLRALNPDLLLTRLSS